MKHGMLVTLSVVVLMALWLPAVLVRAQPGRLPHEDPATAAEDPRIVPLLLFHGDIFALAASGDYQAALERLAEVRRANIAAELLFLWERFGELTHDFVAELSLAERHLAEASGWLEQYRLAEAARKLEAAEAALGRAGLLQVELAEAAETVARRLAGVAPPAAWRPALERLGENMNALQDVLGRLRAEWQALAGTREERARVVLRPTQVGLAVTPGAVFVGERVKVSGRLTADGDVPLGGRTVYVVADGQKTAVVTGADGRYSTDLVLPYRFADSLALQTSYEPSGEDLGVYAAARSEVVSVVTSYYRTQLVVSMPPEGSPGLPVRLSGSVTSSGPPAARQLRVRLDGREMGSWTVAGSFDLSVVVPEDAAPGRHRLTVAVEPAGRYSGSVREADITLVRLPVELAVDTPAVLVVPGHLGVSGRVSYQGQPLSGAVAEVTCGDVRVGGLVTGPDGRFEAELALPLDLSVAGPRRLIIRVLPAEPYLAAAAVTGWAVAVNALSVSLMVVGLLAAAVVVSRRKVRWSRRVPVPVGVAPPAGAAAGAAAPAPGVPPVSGNRGRVVAAYRQAVRTVAGATRVEMVPSFTLREYLGAVAAVMTGGSAAFAGLTALAEAALYAAAEPGADAVATAERLAGAVAREVRRVAA